MNFLVETTVPIEDGWQDRDAATVVVAGRPSDSGASTGTAPRVMRRTWSVETFEQARAMRVALAAVPGVKATLREK